MRTSITLIAPDFIPSTSPIASLDAAPRRTGWHWTSPFRAARPDTAFGDLEFNPYLFQLESDAPPPAVAN